MNFFICPICKSPFEQRGRSLVCPKNHCFDLSKQGYVNLLMSQQGRLHGDDRPMVRARTAFLSEGYYRPLLEAVVAGLCLGGCAMMLASRLLDAAEKRRRPACHRM